MKRIFFLLLAANSWLGCGLANAEVRPRYGGTLHVATAEVLSSLDPADASLNEPGAENILPLVFDTLVSLDAQGVAKPDLANSWESSSNQQRWQLRLRPGVTFSNGTPVSSEVVAASLRKANPNWNISTAGEQVVIESAAADPLMLAELALPRNRIAKRNGGKILGTGPFVVSQWDASKKLIVMARDDYWAGRPFLDSIEIAMGKNPRDQMMAFDMGQAQLVEMMPGQAGRATTEARRAEMSLPNQLLALVFAKAPLSDQELKLRQALSLSIDRKSINSVVMQGAGEPTSAILPNWMTGYAFVFAAAQDLSRAQQLRGEVQQAPVWILGFDTNDAAIRVTAERIALNARDAGLRLQLGDAGAADLRLLRIPLASRDAREALYLLAPQLGLPAPTFAGDSDDELYAAERNLLQSGRVVPLLHLPVAYAVSANVRGWRADEDGRWDLAGAWLAGKP
jgi:peptide/nickel transport system substrate-binding protein